MGVAQVVMPARNISTSLPDYTTEQLESNLESWLGMIEAGRATADRIINMVSSKYTLSDAMKKRIHDLESAGDAAFVTDMDRVEQEQAQ